MALEIKYNGKTIATIEKGQTATIPCKDKKMLTDLIVSLVTNGEELPTLSPPTISLDGDILTMTATDQETEVFAILVDGVERATVANGAVVSLISFTINGTTYQAKEGMTWGEWCDSEYNTDGFYIRYSEYDPEYGSVDSFTGYGVYYYSADNDFKYPTHDEVIRASYVYIYPDGAGDSN